MNAGPSVLPECIALYAIVDPSLNTCTYAQSSTTNPGVVFFYLNSPSLSFRSEPQLPKYSPNPPIPAAQHKSASSYGPIHFASVRTVTTVTQSDGTRTTDENPAFLPIDRIRVELVQDESTSKVGHVNTEDKVNSAVYETV
jgi:hypothetical protein